MGDQQDICIEKDEGVGRCAPNVGVDGAGRVQAVVHEHRLELQLRDDPNARSQHAPIRLIDHRSRTDRTLLQVSAVEQALPLDLDVRQSFTEPGDLSVELLQNDFELN